MRTKRIHVVVNEEEKAYIQAEAKACGMTVSNWARVALIETIQRNPKSVRNKRKSSV